MKTFIKIFLLVVMCVPLAAQDDSDGTSIDDPKGKEQLRAARIAFLIVRLNLTQEEAQKFWPVYLEYSDKRMDLRQRFKHAKQSGTNETELLDLYHKTRQDELDLEKQYSDKFVNIIGAKKLVRLNQSEAEFKKLLLRQVQKRQNQERKQRDRK